MVLSRVLCLGALFIKARALYELEQYKNAYDVNFHIITASKNAETKKKIARKLYLFETRVNEKIGNSNIAICKKLIDVCPECCTTAYLMLRKEPLETGEFIEFNKNENEEVEIKEAFNEKF